MEIHEISKAEKRYTSYIQRTTADNNDITRMFKRKRFKTDSVTYALRDCCFPTFQKPMAINK